MHSDWVCLLTGLIFANGLSAGPQAPAPKTGICPLEEHQVCNDHTKQLRCVCAMSLNDEAPPEKSCTTILDVQNINGFEAVSVIFDLDEAASVLSSFPEDKFRDQIATHLKLDTKDILIVRVHCMDNDKKFAVQFVVVKNEDSDDDNDGVLDSEDPDDGRIPFGQSHFLKASGLVNRMKIIGPMNSLAGLRVDSIRHVDQLYPMESYVDNSVLIMQATIAGIFIFATCLCGCWIACRKSEYDSDLQKT
ncbi:hypothetical protein M3Y98_00280100 [Aphelenchoides besseyi]|nr:hypothetical protein M3Y98_00280100 [Aphelenchoides besseyi]KAI6201031.1 hypothetical protein M3Y96_00798100 [Aphelenchoides besseyi]